MAQTKKQSFKETMTNTGVGMVGSWLITMGCLSLWSNPVVSATVATVGCTVWSIGRGYTIRRYFNKLNEKEKQLDATTIQVKS